MNGSKWAGADVLLSPSLDATEWLSSNEESR
jgi:hypothetical protein